ncbi:MAG: TIGR00295 family protein [Candidatus Altiarchaeota archaeon]
MNDNIHPEEAIILLKASCPENVIAHCKTVSRLAKRIAEKIRSSGHKVDVDFVETAALLHDIGRGVTHGIRHGIEGSDILRDHPEYARVCRNHLGGGIDRNEAAELGLPSGDYIPETLEEKIICYADKLVDGEKEITIDESLEKFRQRLGPDHPSVDRIRRMHEEIQSLMC